MTEFTPGPWELAWEDNKHGVVAASVDGKMVFIGMIGNADDDPVKNESRKANARLMASSPCLLAALEYVLEDDGLIPRATSQCRDVARAAILKARGE